MNNIITQVATFVQRAASYNMTYALSYNTTYFIICQIKIIMSYIKLKLYNIFRQKATFSTPHPEPFNFKKLLDFMSFL